MAKLRTSTMEDKGALNFNGQPKQPPTRNQHKPQQVREGICKIHPWSKGFEAHGFGGQMLMGRKNIKLAMEEVVVGRSYRRWGSPRVDEEGGGDGLIS